MGPGELSFVGVMAEEQIRKEGGREEKEKERCRPPPTAPENTPQGITERKWCKMVPLFTLGRGMRRNRKMAFKEDAAHVASHSF